MTPQELSSDAIPEVSVTQTKLVFLQPQMFAAQHRTIYESSPPTWATIMRSLFTLGFSTFHNNFLNQQRPAQNNINAIMCVVPISYSCGAISHRSLRDHEAGFLSQPRLEVCDCDRVMNIP